MLLSVTALIGFLGAFQGLVLAGAIALFEGGAAREPNRALALLLFVFSVSVAAIVAEHAGLFGGSIWLVLVEYTFSLLFAPALWYYANTVLGTRPRLPLWVHLIPAGVWFGYLLAIGLGWLGTGPTAWRWIPPILSLILYLAAYTIAVAVQAWRRALRQQMLVSHGVVLRVLIVSLFVLHGAQVVRYVFRSTPALTDIVPITGTIMVYVLAVLAFRQSRLFAGHEPAALQRKYGASTLTPERAEEIRRSLLLVMERDKPFLNENLNLAELASRLAIPRVHLSQVVNANLGTSFPQLLNEYRVREAMRLFKDPELAHLTIEAIGYEAGFRSRSGFYSAFKHIMGETPAQARARLS